MATATKNIWTSNDGLNKIFAIYVTNDKVKYIFKK